MVRHGSNTEISDFRTLKNYFSDNFFYHFPFQYGSPKLFMKKSDSDKALNRANNNGRAGGSGGKQKHHHRQHGGGGGGGDRRKFKRSMTMASIPAR